MDSYSLPDLSLSLQLRFCMLPKELLRLQPTVFADYVVVIVVGTNALIVSHHEKDPTLVSSSVPLDKSVKNMWIYTLMKLSMIKS